MMWVPGTCQVGLLVRWLLFWWDPSGPKGKARKSSLEGAPGSN